MATSRAARHDPAPRAEAWATLAIRLVAGLVVCVVTDRVVSGMLFPHQALQQLSWATPTELVRDLLVTGAAEAVDRPTRSLAARAVGSMLAGLTIACLAVWW